MNSREEFEKWCKENTDLQNYYIDPSGQYANDHVLYAYEAWQHQQKIIDELKANNFAMSAMVCKHPDKRTLDENYDTMKDYCDVLKAENPDVPCPACEGSGDDKDEDFNDALGKCGYCNNGTVPLTKAREYRIRELEAEIKRLDK